MGKWTLRQAEGRYRWVDAMDKWIHVWPAVSTATHTEAKTGKKM